MKHCARCGAELDDNERFCRECGEPQDNSQQNYQEYQDYQQGGYQGYQQDYQNYNQQNQGYQQGYPNQGYQQPYQDGYYNQYQQLANPDDKSSVGFMILSFLVPFLGLILYAIWLKSFPQKAKSCLKGAVASIVFYLVVVALCCGCGMVGSMLGS